MSDKIGWEQELPVAKLPDDPAFRENYCFWGYDRERAVGFWIHMGRWPLDNRVWREQVLIYLPDGDYLVHRAWGHRESDKGPSSALLDIICKEPGKHWQLRYRGPARRTTTEEVHAGGLLEGPQILLDMDIAFTSSVPIWDMSKHVQNQDWAKFHMEQNGRLTGPITVDGKTVEMDGFGWRDHSRGPRNISSLVRHIFINGDLPEGRSFAITYIETEENGQVVLSLAKGVIWSEGKIYEAHTPNPPFLDPGVFPPPEHYSMTLVSELGELHIDAHTPCSLPHTSSKEYNVYDGVARGMGHILCYEQGTVFTIDGRQYNGHSERSHRME
ncbi:MAG: hypothetical protein WC997_03735 [Porticoccaceae bacterium]